MAQNNVPNHVAIILDGNRRFAKRLMLEPWKGHEHGKEKLETLIQWCIDLGIKELTVYTFSIQNFERPKQEFDYLMNLIEDAFRKFLEDERVKKNSIKVNVIGRYHMFPKKIVDIIEEVQEYTKDNRNFTINFALAYGGREEITDAVKNIALEIQSGKLNPKDITEKVVHSHLMLKSDPDLIIRTGGEKRTSNFLMWQSSYSEWFFMDKMWPEFTKEDLVNVIEEFKSRERRFGK